MPIQSGETAPYAPPSTVIEVITRYRDRGLAKPFDTDVLQRAGVPVTLARRVFQSLKLLELIDESGYPTEQFEDIARVPQDQFKARFADMIRAVYAEVFSFADPATDDPDRIRDAFRSFNPRGQQERMVTLFLGLCEVAGIIEAIPKRPSGVRKGEVRATRPSTSKNGTQARGKGGGMGRTRPGLAFGRSSDSIPPMLLSLMAELPEAGQPLTKEERERFKAMFGTLLDYYFPEAPALSVVESAEQGAEE